MEKPKAKEYYDLRECVAYVENQLGLTNTTYIAFVRYWREVGPDSIVTLPHPENGSEENQAIGEALIATFGAATDYLL